MLDRSRMALCAFTFLFLSLNPLAALFCSSGITSAGNTADITPHHAGRSVLGVDVAGKTTYSILITVKLSVLLFARDRPYFLLITERTFAFHSGVLGVDGLDDANHTGVAGEWYSSVRSSDPIVGLRRAGNSSAFRIIRVILETPQTGRPGPG